MELSVLGRKILVRFVSEKELDKLGSDTGLLGLYTRGHIYISTSVPNAEVKRVLLHELVHAFLDVSGVSHLLKGPQEEAICNSLEGLLGLFQDDSFTKFLNNQEE